MEEKMGVKKNKPSPSQDFLEKKELIALDLEASKIKKKLALQVQEYKRVSDRVHHERELERGRNKSAEMKKFLHLKHSYRR